jgi:hypothetical protein
MKVLIRTLPLDYVVWQLIRVSQRLWKVRGQYAADFLNRFDQRIAKVLVLKMRPHSGHNSLPELVTAFLVNRLIANYSELVRPWHHENQDRIALARLVHAQLTKFFLRGSQRIALQFAALNKNANLAGSLGFRLANRLHNPIVLEFTKELSRPHFRYQLEPAPPPPKLPPPPLNPLKPPPPPDDQPPPPPIGKKTGPLRPDE